MPDHPEEHVPTPDRGLRALIPLVIGALLAGYVLERAFGESRTNFADLDLGISTVTYYAKHDGDVIHARDQFNADELIDAWRRRGEHPVGLYLANSQVHGINQYQPGQENVAAMLFQQFQPRGIDILTFTQASASLQEHYVLFEYLRPRLHPRFLILPVVFMNQRNVDIRAGVAESLADPQAKEEFDRTAIGRRLQEQFGQKSAGADDLGALRETVQERTEKAINGWLDEHWQLWALRPEARGRIASDLIRARNTLLGISGQSKRHMIRGAYDANMEALAAILQSAREHGVRVLVYIPPIRDDYEPPYIPAEYDAFRQHVQQLAAESGAVFADLEHSVPSEYYGVHDSRVFGEASQPDFFHFQEAAHRRLANALAALIESQILPTIEQPAPPAAQHQQRGTVNP